jgi:hypothetical protein
VSVAGERSEGCATGFGPQRPDLLDAALQHQVNAHATLDSRHQLAHHLGKAVRREADQQWHRSRHLDRLPNY